MNGHRSWVPVVWVGRLVDALAAVPLTPPMRNSLVDMFVQGVRDEDLGADLDVPRDPSPRQDAMHVIQAAVRRRGALRALARAIHVVAGGLDTAAAFVVLAEQVASLEAGWLPDHDREALVDELDGLSTRVDVAALVAMARNGPSGDAPPATYRGAVAQLAAKASPVWLFRFLEYAAAEATDADVTIGLRDWVDSRLGLVPAHRQAEIIDLRCKLSEQGTGGPGRPYLLVSLEPVDAQRFCVFAWLSQDGRRVGANCGPDEVVTHPQLCTWLSDVLETHRVGALAPGRRPLIEFVLPPRHMHEKVDAYEVTVDGQTFPLGKRYRVVIRPAYRDDDALTRLARRWQIATDVMAREQAADRVAQWISSTQEQAAALHDAADWAWLAITCPLVTVTPEALAYVVDTGTPIALWVRSTHPNQNPDTLLREIASNRGLDDLPDAVRRFRERGWNAHAPDASRDLVLMWDDPTRPSPADGRLTIPAGVPNR